MNPWHCRGICLIVHQILVHSAYWYRRQPVQICWLMVQSSYYFNLVEPLGWFLRHMYWWREIPWHPFPMNLQWAETHRESPLLWNPWLRCNRMHLAVWSFFLLTMTTLPGTAATISLWNCLPAGGAISFPAQAYYCLLSWWYSSLLSAKLQSDFDTFTTFTQKWSYS